MFHEPVEDFVRRAMGLMRVFDEADQDRLEVRPGAPLSRPADLPLPDRAPVAAPELELIEAEAPRAASGVEISHPEAPAGGWPDADPPAAARPQAEFAPIPAAGAARALPEAAPPATPAAEPSFAIRFLRIAQHGDMDQRLISVAQANALDDRDVVGPGASADMALGLDGLSALAGLARDLLAEAAAGSGPQGLGAARLPETPAGDGAPVSPGGNEMANAAAIVETGTEIGLLAVLGDARTTTTILQLNALDDGGTGAGGAQNTLRQIDLPAIPVLPVAATGPVSLSLKVVEGDFFDITRITQTQVFDDRDVIVWSEAAEHLRVASGGNLGANAAVHDLTGWGAEIVIVQGDYLALREIVQVNLAADADRTGPAPEAAGAGAGAGGGTQLANSAVLAMPAGAGTLGAMPDDIAALVAALAAGETPAAADLARWDADGDGTVEAMLVRGDYVDVKSIRQVNILADADLVLGAPAPPPAEASAAPANRLTNEAVLIDATAGARQGVLAGQHYDQTFLLDANLLGDPTLAPGGARLDLAGGAGGGGIDLPPAALADAILFDAPTWGA